ncbi:MAG: hypothetical protein KGH50_04775, partial [Candidatus Micrarchaeota archaeon]|nr:hypothetical protein [Candidatus Micrarchaeota archaeon]
MRKLVKLDKRAYKSQSAVEYLSIYGWVIIALAVFLAIAYVLISGNTTPTTSYCYISPGLTCMQTFVISNSVTSKAVVLFQNNLGVKMEMATNPFSFADPYSASIYSGKCYPNIVPPGGIVTCNVTLSSLKQQPTGTQINPKFSIDYLLCDPVCGSSTYNTSGSASVFTS